MALVGHISGSTQTSSKIGITGSVIVANRPNASFPTLPSDVTFYVSGSSDGTEKSLFGGDLVVSGSAKAQLGLSGSLTKLFDGRSYLVAGTSVTIVSSSNGQVTISSAGGGGTPAGSDDQIQYNDAGSFGASSNFTYNGSTVHLTGSFSQGDNTFVYDGTYGHAEGRNSVAQGNYSHGEGFSAEARGHYSHAEGVITVAIGEGAHSEGNDNTASGSFSHAEGELTFTYGYASHAEGVGSITKEGIGSHAEGYYTITSASYSHAEGFQTITSGTYSHAEGRSTIARGPYSHAEGRLTLASANYSHAEGESTTASGAASHSEGFLTIASQASAHSEGEYTIASGGGSHAEGGTTSATGYYAHAEGEFTTATGYGSHAEGNETTTIGTFSHAEGFRTIASGSYQHVQGKYNTRNNNFSLFVVGNGTGTADASRSDVFRINAGILGNGRVEVTGSFVSTIGLSGSLTNLSDGTSYLVAGSNITISSASNGAITISSTGGGGAAADDFFDSTTAGSIFTTGSAAFRGAESISSPADKGSDVFFYVSGSTNGTDKSLFGGEIFVSGNIVTAGDIQVAGNDIKSSTGATAITLDGTNVIIPGDLTVNGTTVTINTTNLEVKDAVIGLGFSSGTIAQTAGDRGLIVGLAGSDNATFLWKHTESEFAFGRTTSSATGSLPISISSYSNIHAGNVQAAIVTASLGFSGSLTRLTDGTSYLIAGNNVTISSESNGSITISTAVTDDFFDSTTPGSIFTTGSVAFRGDESIDSPQDKGTDVFFYVSGSTGAVSNNKSLFGGDLVISGSLFAQGDILEMTGSISATSGFSGSLTRLTDGTSYIIAGTNVTVTSASNGAVTISSTASGGGDPGAQYLVLSATASLSDERVFTAGSGINTTDGGAGGNFTLSINDSVVATVSGSTFTGATKHNVGLSGSLTQLTDGTSYLVAGTNVTITSASNGSITISSAGGGGTAADDFFDSTTAGSIFTTGSAAFRGAESIDSPSDKGTDVFFYVSGSTSATRSSTSLFGGYVWISGSLVQGNFGVSGGATGQYARAHGERTTASGASSHAEGRFALAQGVNSHAEGDSTAAYGAGSHAEGLDSAAFAAYSHAEGRSTEARGLYSHAEGYDAIPRADYSHAEGRDTQVLTAGLYAHAEGSGSIAIGEASHAEGLGTLASGSYQLAVGKYNTRDNTSSLFVVGNGTSDSAANRSDIFRVEQSSVQVTGSFVSTLGLSGSLTKLANGSSYLVAGSNVTITSASNGSVTISSTGGGGGGSNYLRFLAGTVTSTAASGSMESVGMDYLSSGLVGATTYTFEVILATTAGTTAYMDLYDYSGVINGTPGPIAGSVLTGSSQSYTYLSANVTSQFSLASGPGIIEARVWCTPNGSGLNAICKNAKLKVE